MNVLNMYVEEMSFLKRSFYCLKYNMFMYTDESSKSEVSEVLEYRLLLGTRNWIKTISYQKKKKVSNL